MWVVELNGTVEGYGHLRLYEKDGERKAEIWGLYFTPNVAGQGLGLQLSEIMLNEARKFGAKKITLQSSLTAHQFYKKLGFEDTGPVQQEIINGHPVRNYPMKMIL